MPDHNTPGVPPAANAALQVRPPNALSTYVLPPAITAADDDEALHLRDLWRVIVKRKWVVLAVFVIVIATAWVATNMQTPIYRATITLKIEREASKVIDFKGAPAVPEESGDADFYRTQYELLKSRTLAERVVKQLDLRQRAAPAAVKPAPWWSAWWASLTGRDHPEKAAEPPAAPADPYAAAVGAFQGSMTVEPVRNSRLVRVLFDSPEPKLAADALNALAKNFIAANLERRYDASSYAKTFLEEKLAYTKARLEDSERALVDFQREQQIVNVDDKQNVLSQTLIAYNAAAAKSGEERLRAEALFREFKENPQSSPQMLDNKSMAALREQRTKLSVEYQDLLRVYKPAYPKMQQLKASMDEIDSKIKEESEIVRRSIEGAYNVSVQQEASVKAKLDGVKKEVLDLQGRSVRYSILKREVETNRSLYDGLLQRLKEVGVEAGVGTNNVTVVDSALTPGSPFKPNLAFNLQVAAALALLLGVGLAFFLDYLDDTMQQPEEMERISHLPVLGVIPLVKPKRGQKSEVPAMLSHFDARSAFAEAYRSVRTALQFSTREGAPRQLVVTSTTAKEGKSTTALSLAINFAQADQPVLVIDADLRHPAMHELLNVDNSRGLSNYLAGDLPALGVVRVTSIPNLYVIPAGPPPPNPVELLSGPKLIGLLRRARAAVLLHHPRLAARAGPGRRAGARQPGRRGHVRRGRRHDAQGAPARGAETPAPGERRTGRRRHDQASHARRHVRIRKRVLPVPQHQRNAAASVTGGPRMAHGSPADHTGRLLLWTLRPDVDGRAGPRADLPLADAQVVLKLALGRHVEFSDPSLRTVDPVKLRDAAATYVRRMYFRANASPYQVLGLAPGASESEIKESFRLLMQLVHPDRQEGRAAWPESFAARANHAYAILRDAAPRAKLDQEERERVAQERASRDVARRAPRHSVPRAMLPEWLTAGVGGFVRNHPAAVVFAALLAVAAVVIAAAAWEPPAPSLTRAPAADAAVTPPPDGTRASSP